jgi:hypothetical protein
LTDGVQGQTANAWYSKPVNVQSFAQDFVIQLTNPAVDGMTFIIQNMGASAAGYAGGNLGYTAMTPSVAIKFDLFSNVGEGPNSTGVYTGGAQPMLPATDLGETRLICTAGTSWRFT